MHRKEVRILRIFKIFIAEILRMLRDRKWLYLLIIAVVYIVICRMFASYRYKLDLDYGVEMRFGESAFKIWQFTMDSMQMGVLLYVLPPMVYVLSYMNDRKEKVDQYICVKSQSDVYYAIKYVVAILGGMILNFLFVTLLYLPLYQIIASHVYRIDDLDRVNTLVGPYLKSDKATVAVLLIAAEGAMIGGICVAMSFILSMWLENRILVTVLPYISFRILRNTIYMWQLPKKIVNLAMINVDTGFYDRPVGQYFDTFAIWMLIFGILFFVSYFVNIRRKR